MFDFNRLPKKRRHIRKVQLGAGNNCPPEFINIDIAGSPSLDIRQDLRNPLPFPDESIEEFYSHHVLEHFILPDLQSLLREVWRCLRPGGRLVSRLPDFHHATRQLLTEPSGPRRDALMLCVYGGRPYGWTPLPEHTHEFGWTTTTLKEFLESCGFLVVQCDSVGSDSTLPCIDFVALKSTQFHHYRTDLENPMWGERQVEVPWLYSKILPGTVLDIGSAESCYVDGLLERGVTKLVLNDIRPFSTHETDSRVTCVVGDIRKSIDSLGTFDNVLLISTLEHMAMDSYGQHREVPSTHSVYYPQRDAMYHMQKLIKPGTGQMLVTVPYGKFEDCGWVIVYNQGMVAEFKHFFNVVEETYFTLVDRDKDTWRQCRADECPEKGMDVHARGMRANSVCCLVIKRKEE